MSAMSLKDVGRDLTSGLVVYLVALPLCLGIALASDAPIVSGLVAGIVGGLVVGALSGSHTSVAGPAAGLTAVVAAQIAQLGSFSAFLVAVVLAGVLQIGLGVARAGFLASFFPSSVIKGLLAAIGVILILKQIPHLLGHDSDVEGEMEFLQRDGENSFTEIIVAMFDIQPGAAAIGIGSLILLLAWDRIKLLKNSQVPGALVVVVGGVGANWLLATTGSQWVVDNEHLVQVPTIGTLADATEFLAFPDWSILSNPAVYMAAVTIAIVASLETLLNLDAVDRIDPKQRHSPPSRELLAQGVGNVVAGMIGGLPMTSVIVRSSVNISTGNKTKLSTIFHGALLLSSVLTVPELLNTIPLSALAAILFVTGLKLAKPALFAKMWKQGLQQFFPFIATVVVIVFTDLLIGVLVGLAVAITFILRGNLTRPIRLFAERHMSGDILRLELANQVSFFNRASLEHVLRDVPPGTHILIDARNTDLIDPDILDLIDDFCSTTAPAHGVEVSLLGFENTQWPLNDQINFVDYASPELQLSLRPSDVLDILREGNNRFRHGQQLTRDLMRQKDRTARGQSPMAVVLSCIDSRAPAEHVFDLGIGEIFSVRIAGNVAREKVLGSIEFSCKVAGAKLIVVMGHTSCGAVTSAVDLRLQGKTALEATGCENLDVLIQEIQKVVDTTHAPTGADASAKARYVDDVARKNVLRTINVLRERSPTLDGLIREGTIDIVGAMYDVRSGAVDFIPSASAKPVGPTGHAA